MILYYFPIAQNTVNQTVNEKFYRGVYACICMCTYFTIFLFTGLIPVYPLLIAFANSLDLDQDRQNVGPDLDPKCLAL